MDAGRDIGGHATVADGGKQVELERGQNGAALLEGADAVIQIVRQRAGSFARVHDGQALLAGDGHFGADLVDIAAFEARQRPAVAEVLFHQLRRIGWSQAAVPGSLRIHDRVGAAFAKPQRAARGHLHLAFEAARRHLAPQGFDYGKAAAGTTARRAFRLLLVANEYVIAKGLHGIPPQMSLTERGVRIRGGPGGVALLKESRL